MRHRYRVYMIVQCSQFMCAINKWSRRSIAVTFHIGQALVLYTNVLTCACEDYECNAHCHNVNNCHWHKLSDM